MQLSEAIRQRIRAIEPNRAVYDVKRLSDYVSSTLTERRFQMILLSSFAAIALLLAAIGLYGVTSFLVSLRTREIGLRAALGATPSRIFAQILREGALITAAGIACGLVAALALTRSIATLLFGIAPTDPITFVARACSAGVCFGRRVVAAGTAGDEYRSDGSAQARVTLARNIRPVCNGIR